MGMNEYDQLMAKRAGFVRLVGGRLAKPIWESARNILGSTLLSGVTTDWDPSSMIGAAAGGWLAGPASRAGVRVGDWAENKAIRNRVKGSPLKGDIRLAKAIEKNPLANYRELAQSDPKFKSNFAGTSNRAHNYTRFNRPASEAGDSVIPKILGTTIGSATPVAGMLTGQYLDDALRDYVGAKPTHHMLGQDDNKPIMERVNNVRSKIDAAKNKQDKNNFTL